MNRDVDNQQSERIFEIDQLAKFDKDQAQRISFYRSERTAGSVWCLEPGQEVVIHTHSDFDDIWICLAGEGTYFFDDGQEVPIKQGMVCLAKTGQKHGMRNTGKERFIFVSIAG